MHVYDEFVDGLLDTAVSGWQKVTNDHTDHRFERHRRREDPAIDQSICSVHLRRGAWRLSCLLVVDVGGRQIRTEDDLKNPSTTRHA